MSATFGRSQKKPSRLKKTDTNESMGPVNRMVTHAVFESTFIALIVCNACVMALESQYNGLTLGYNLAYPGHEAEGKDVWPLAETTFRVLGFAFGCVFTGELVLKMIGLRFEFFCSLWNMFDLVVISIWLMTEAFNVDIGPNPMVS